MLRQLLGDAVTLTVTSTSPSPVPVLADPRQLEEVIPNLALTRAMRCPAEAC